MMLFGYDNFDDFLHSMFKGVHNDFVLKWVLPIFTGIHFLFTQVFDSEEGMYFLITLYCIDFITGFGKSVKYSLKVNKLLKKGEEIPNEIYHKRLVSKRFPRFLITMSAALLLLGILSFAAKFSVVYIAIFPIFYSIFLGQQIISITENLNEMGLIPSKVYNKLKKHITDYFDKEE